LDTSAVLVKAASGLQKNMGGTKGAVLQDSTVAQISAAIYYQASVISKVTTNKQFQSKFQSILFNQIKKDFGNYVDSQSRTNPKTLHHVYEWKKAGTPSARLFDLKVVGTDGLSFKISSEFKPSKSMVPTNFGKARHVYAQFFTGNLVNLSIKNSKFQQIFNSSIAKAMKLPVDVKKVKYSFSPNTLNMQAGSALAAAFGGSDANGL